MAIATDSGTQARAPLSRERVLRAAVDLADREGIGSLSMRKIGQELGVEAMSLYNHVANKEEILDGIVDLVVGEIEPPLAGVHWKVALRRRILSAREMLVRHPWASAVIVTRVNITPTMMSYMESTCGILRGGGFSVDLTHHAIHVFGSRIFGFVQELYDDSEALAESPEVAQIMLDQMSSQFPHLTELATQITHDGPLVGVGCDTQFEFEFGLDLILDGFERMLADPAPA
ncbi:MAG TPA: TetR/AcrR family transcriptional regulator C-terminal domain-containing protein [Candidatus Limnocylindria bacterium]